MSPPKAAAKVPPLIHLPGARRPYQPSLHGPLVGADDPGADLAAQRVVAMPVLQAPVQVLGGLAGLTDCHCPPQADSLPHAAF